MWLDEPGLSQYGHGAVGGLMEAYALGELQTEAERRETIDYTAAYEVAKRRLGTRRKITVDEIIEAAL